MNYSEYVDKRTELEEAIFVLELEMANLIDNFIISLLPENDSLFLE